MDSLERKSYPRTPHLPYSPGGTSDDKRLESSEHFLNKHVIITEKLDGGCTLLQDGQVYARSVNVGSSHESFDFIKRIYAEKCNVCPGLKHFSLYGENLYAVHSIEYKKLFNPFYLFHVLFSGNFWGWDGVKGFASTYGFLTVPEIFRGTFKTETQLQIWMEENIKNESVFGGPREGFVIRTSGAFEFADFKKNMAKYVRPNHVQTDERWERNWRKQNIVMQEE